MFSYITNSPLFIYDIWPVSSLTTTAKESVFSVIPRAALCLSPKWDGISSYSISLVSIFLDSFFILSELFIKDNAKDELKF